MHFGSLFLDTRLVSAGRVWQPVGYIPDRAKQLYRRQPFESGATVQYPDRFPDAQCALLPPRRWRTKDRAGLHVAIATNHEGAVVLQESVGHTSAPWRNDVSGALGSKESSTKAVCIKRHPDKTFLPLSAA